MPYKLFVDKNEDFECEVAVKNASLKNSMARLVVETDDGPCFIFKGLIREDKCVIPIKRLKGLVDEGIRGKMHLEMIVEDTYFRPWESDFVVEEHTSVKVRVNETKAVSNKPSVEFKRVKVKEPVKKIIKEEKEIIVPLKEISMICDAFGIGRKNLKERKLDFALIVKEYLKANPEYNKDTRKILSEIRNFLK